MIQEIGGGLKEPRLVVYKDKDQSSTISYSTSEDIHDLESSIIAGDKRNFLDNRDGLFLDVYLYLVFVCHFIFLFVILFNLGLLH